jgi:hypothetical protein
VRERTGSLPPVPCLANPFHVRALPERLALVPRPLPPAGRLLALTRAGIWVLFVLALANGAFLYLVPSQALTHYAWSIKPPVSAAFIGAGFLAGTLVTGLVLGATKRWRSLQTLPPALWVLATSLLVATIVHHGKCKFDYPPTWVWVIVYAGVPLAVPILVYRQRRAAESRPAADPTLRTTKLLSAVIGALLLAGAIALYAAPVAVGKHWPWLLTPLLGRVVAAWYALFGTMLVSCAIGLRHASEAVLPYVTLAAWCVLLLALPLLHPGDVDTGTTAFWLWTAGMVVLLALAAHALSRALPAARRSRL